MSIPPSSFPDYQDADSQGLTREIPFWNAYYAVLEANGNPNSASLENFSNHLSAYISQNPDFNAQDVEAYLSHRENFANFILDRMGLGGGDFPSAEETTIQEFIRTSYILQGNQSVEKTMTELSEEIKNIDKVLSSISTLTTLYNKKGQGGAEVLVYSPPTVQDGWSTTPRIENPSKHEILSELTIVNESDNPITVDKESLEIKVISGVTFDDYKNMLKAYETLNTYKNDFPDAIRERIETILAPLKPYAEKTLPGGGTGVFWTESQGIDDAFNDWLDGARTRYDSGYESIRDEDLYESWKATWPFGLEQVGIINEFPADPWQVHMTSERALNSSELTNQNFLKLIQNGTISTQYQDWNRVEKIEYEEYAGIETSDRISYSYYHPAEKFIDEIIIEDIDHPDVPLLTGTGYTYRSFVAPHPIIEPTQSDQDNTYRYFSNVRTPITEVNPQDTTLELRQLLSSLGYQRNSLSAEVKESLFHMEEFYKSGTTVIEEISSLLEGIARRISR